MKKRNTYLLIVLTTLLSFGAMMPSFAQQDAQYSQYMFNGLVINPAFAGSKQGSSLTMFYRTQWVGFEGHPVSQSVSYHQPFYFNKAGFGLHIQNDRIGLEQKTSAISSWAYRINSKKYTISFGLQAGIQSYSLDQARLNTQDDDDQTFYPNVSGVVMPDIGFGVYYKSKQLYVGFSVPHILETEIDVNNYQANLEMAKMYRHYYATTAYRWKINRDWDLIPSVLVKTDGSSISPTSIDLTSHIMFQDKIWGGATYRFDDSFSFQLGTNLDQLSKKFEEKIKIGYAFDLTTSSFSAYNNGSHEIMIMYDFGGDALPVVRTPRFRY